jgi:hypothetical protein
LFEFCVLIFVDHSFGCRHHGGSRSFACRDGLDVVSLLRCVVGFGA